MTFTLDHVVPWGRTHDEYVRLFDLQDADLTRAILGCADGPAAFNACWTRRGGHVVSCDPIYQFSVDQIRSRVMTVADIVVKQTQSNLEAFVWSSDLPDVGALRSRRLRATDAFLDDLREGKREHRYVTGQLPTLPFADDAFDLVLCSHYLFLYGDLGLEFHLQSVAELCRVGGEVRIFPLTQLDGQPSPFVEPITQQAKRSGYHVERRRVDYEFQRGANTMLRLSRFESSTCESAPRPDR
ncbi:SAM-dependent methyltransferase [Roseiconus nitratireducens]|uniref:SAM-dependent methyltransferase n=1 Tax=Roseiconus nitratireducens TaxID=2605748 RepID=A0A5M6DCZ8_9BACT|nr:SAM-dependent methyltransferase [Roseiconus nitratireducens]KAA5545441.1 SAM-dependent methyltransferase [Roseiconus nitratireducens]